MSEVPEVVAHGMLAEEIMGKQNRMLSRHEKEPFTGGGKWELLVNGDKICYASGLNSRILLLSVPV